MKKTTLFLLMAAVMLVTPTALATHVCPTGPNASNPGSHDPISGIAIPCSPANASGFQTMINTVFNVVFGILVIVASFMLLYAAFEYLTARGESEKLAKARNMIVYAIVALVVAMFAWGLPRVIISFFPGGAV